MTCNILTLTTYVLCNQCGPVNQILQVLYHINVPAAPPPLHCFVNVKYLPLFHVPIFQQANSLKNEHKALLWEWQCHIEGKKKNPTCSRLDVEFVAELCNTTTAQVFFTMFFSHMICIFSWVYSWLCVYGRMSPNE